MKIIALILLLGLSLAYNPGAAVDYARKYCKNYNPNYPSYRNSGGDCANFVSQCLIAGGFSFSGCDNVKKSGVIAGVTSLRNCLKKKGWKVSTTKPASFTGGYPMARTDLGHAIMATSVSGNKITYCGHTSDVCDRTLDYAVYYMYP